jgi:hypothetical protein
MLATTTVNQRAHSAPARRARPASPRMTPQIMVIQPQVVMSKTMICCGPKR